MTRDSCGTDIDRKVLSAAAPSCELKALLMSHAVDRSNDHAHKMMLIGVTKKARFNS